MSLKLAQTDPALYSELRAQITRFFLRGGEVFSQEKLEALSRARSAPDDPAIALPREDKSAKSEDPFNLS